MQLNPGTGLKTAVAVFLMINFFMGCEGSFVRNKIDESMGKKEEVKPPAPPPAPVAVTPPAVPPVQTPAQTTMPPPTTPLGSETTLTTTTPAAPTTPAVPPAPGVATNEEKVAEMNLYVQCLNRAVPRANDSYRRYLSWVNERTGPTCKEQYVSYSLYTLYEDGIKKCQDAASRGAAGGPSWPKVEKAAADLSAAFAELVPLAQQASDYYQQQDYKDDNCAKGQALHPKLMDAFSRLRKASTEIDTELKPIKEELDAAELMRIEQTKGKNLEWQVRAMGIAARRLVNTVPEENAAAFQASEYLALYPKLDESYNSFSTFVTANPTQTEGVFWFSAFQNSAKEFYTKAKFLKRDLAEGKKPDGRAMQDLIEDYNRFISDSNNLRFKM